MTADFVRKVKNKISTFISLQTQNFSLTLLQTLLMQVFKRKIQTREYLMQKFLGKKAWKSLCDLCIHEIKLGAKFSKSQFAFIFVQNLPNIQPK